MFGIATQFLRTFAVDVPIEILGTGTKHASLGLTRASIGYYFLADHSMVSVAANNPRYEYDGSGNYQGILIEAGRGARSATPDRVHANYNVKVGTSAASSALASYFTNSVQFPTSSGTTNNGSIAVSVINATTYTFTAFVKMDDNSAPVVGNSTTGDFSINMFATGSTPNLASAPFTVTHVGNDVYRVSATAVCPASASSNFGLVQHTTQSQKGFRLTGINVIGAAVPTSYIPINTTYNPDLLSGTLAALGVSSTVGTFVVEHDAISGGTLLSSGSNTILASIGGGKTAVAYDGSGSKTCTNGGSVSSAGALTFSTSLRVGANSSNIGINGHIKSVLWYSRKFSDAELQSATT